MKLPKVIVTYCPRCKAHTEHTPSIYKKGKDRKTSMGARYHEEIKHGYGGQKYPELVRTWKTTKKQVIKLKCKKCGYTVVRPGIRMRKIEIVEK